MIIIGYVVLSLDTCPQICPNSSFVIFRVLTLSANGKPNR